MTLRVAEIWRHPIKAFGREALQRVTLNSGKCLPFDRHWAVAHESAKLNESGWSPCANFLRGAKAPLLMAITASLDEATNTVTLTHPKGPGITFNPANAKDIPGFLEWIRPLCPSNRPSPSHIVQAGRGMTDSDFPSISVLNLASHREVEKKLGRNLSINRWRGNIIVDGGKAWEERSWIGKRLRIGDAELEIRENITRCRATTASTRTGERDADTLGTLNDGWGHQQFGVYGMVTKPGVIVLDEPAEVIE